MNVKPSFQAVTTDTLKLRLCRRLTRPVDLNRLSILYIKPECAGCFYKTTIRAIV